MKRMLRIALTLIFFSLGGISFAQPSFDCGLARTAVERTICGNQTLSQLDLELTDAFSQERKLLDAPYLDLFLKQQRAWLSSREKCRAEDISECLANLYRARVNEINALIALRGGWWEEMVIEGEPQQFVILRDLSSALPTLQDAFRFSGGGTDSLQCDLVVNAPKGHASNFGAICRTPKRDKFMICGDDMVGNAHVEPITTSSPSARDLAVFTLSHCFGG